MTSARGATRAKDTPETIDDYIARFPPAVRRILERIRRTIRRAAPGAEERISYQMPAFRLERGGIVAWFGGFKEHVGLYPPVRDPALRRATARYAGPKGNLRFRFDEPIPYALIERIVRSRIAAKAKPSATRSESGAAKPTTRRKVAAKKKARARS